jgi:hypothetical protein
MFRIENTSRSHCGTETTDDIKTTVSGLVENEADLRGNVEKLGDMFISLSERISLLETIGRKFDMMQKNYDLHSNLINESNKTIGLLNTRLDIAEDIIEDKK